MPTLIRTPSYIAICLLAGASLLCGCGAADAARPVPGRIYVGGQSSELRVLDGEDLSPQPTLVLPAPAQGFGLDRAANELDIWMGGGVNALGIANPLGQRLTGLIPLGGRPTGWALAAKSDVAYLTLEGAGAQGTVVKVDLKARRILGRQRMGAEPSGVSLSWDGAQLAVASAAERSVTLLAAPEMRRQTTVELDAVPTQMIGLPYGHRLFVLCPATDQVAVIDTERGGLLTYLAVGPAPAAMILKPDGGEIYVSNFGGGTVSILDTSALVVSGTMLAGSGPQGMAVRRDGSALYVANALSDSLAIINLGERKMIAAVTVGSHPTTVALGPGGQYVFVADAVSNDIAVLRTDPRTLATALITLTPTLRQPGGLAMAETRP